jgi:hypothetical protein
MDPEQVVQDHRGKSAVEWDSEMLVSIIVAGETAASVEDGYLAAEPSRENGGLYGGGQVVFAESLWTE